MAIASLSRKRTSARLSGSFLETLILAIPLILLLVFLLAPVVVVMIFGLAVGPGSSFIDTMLLPVTHNVIAFTLYQALLSTCLSVMLGIPGAFLLSRIDFRGKSFVRSALIVPFVLPPIVVVVGFIQMLGPYGLLDSLVITLTGAGSSVIDLSTGISGIILAHAFYNTPLVLLMVSAALERLDPDLEESAELLGATSWQKIRHVILPHILPALLASAILVFLFCFMSFPIVLGLGESRYMTLEVRIWNAFNFFDYGQASSLAIVQVMITMVLAYTYVKLGRTDSSDPRKTASIKTIRFTNLSRRISFLVMIYLTILIVLITGPFIAIIRSSIYDPIVDEYTLRGFFNLFSSESGGGLLTLVNSISFALVATIFAIILGLPLAYIQRSKSSAINGVSSMMTLLPLGVSSITIAYGLMFVIAVPLGLTINTWPLIIIAQTIIGLPFSARSIEIALGSIDPAILNQADSLGATRLQKLFHVELPLLAPGILVGGVFAFAMAIGEMSATIFLAPLNSTLPVEIYHNLGIGRLVEAGAAALVIVIICFIAFLVIQKFSEMSSGGAL